MREDFKAFILRTEFLHTAYENVSLVRKGEKPSVSKIGYLFNVEGMLAVELETQIPERVQKCFCSKEREDLDSKIFESDNRDSLNSISH